MNEDRRWQIDTILKAAGLCIAGFGIFEFFDNQRSLIERAAQARSLEYIAAANSVEHQGAEQALFEFWLRNSDVVEMLQERGQTASGLRTFFVLALRNYPSGNGVVVALRQAAHLFDEVSVCVSSGICDRHIVHRFFCKDAIQLEMTYDPILELLREQSGDRALGYGLSDFVVECEDET